MSTSQTATGADAGATSLQLDRTAAVDRGDMVEALKRVIRLAFTFRGQAVLAIVATVLSALAQLAIPFLLGEAVSQTQTMLEAGQGTRSLTVIGAVLLGMSVLRGILTMAQNYYAEAVGHRIGRDIRMQVYDKVQRLPYSFHDRVHSGDLITVGMLDLEGVRMFFSTGFIRGINLALLVGIGAWLLISTDVVLGVLALAFVPFAAWRSSAAHLALRATWLQLQEKLGVLSRVMEENLAGIRVVRAFASQEFEMDKFDRASAPALELSHRRVQLRVSNTSFMTLSFFLSMLLVLWVGGLRVVNGQTDIGTLTTMLTFMTILQMPIRQLGMTVNSFARASTCGARLFKLIDLPPAVDDKPGAPELAITEGTLTFENVSFAYGEGHEPALRNISFTARRGETIGIAGAPGSGKTTLAMMIPRFYDVTGGRVLIDGQDLRDVTLASLRQQVNVVMQDGFLFTTSIENNVAYGEPTAAEARLHKAATSAQFHDYVLGLPQGYRTVVGERGGSLSGGQRQRLSIARSLLLHPAVMVFDDSTAAIDAGTEQRLRRAMRENEDERVTFVIAHRLGSIMHADRIFFLENGEIVEEGTHDELVALGGRYAALHRLQMRPDEDGESAA